MSHWGSTQWVKFAEVVYMVFVAGAYVFAFFQAFMGLVEGRAKTPAASRLAFGRCLRHMAVLTFIAGAIHSTEDTLARPFTFRSFAWIIGSWFAFLAWAILDRRRWDLEG